MERAPGGDPEEDAEREEVQNWKDAQGTPVPIRAVTAFEKAKQFEAVCREIDGIIRRVEELAKGPGGRLINLTAFDQHIRDAKGILWANRATHVCPYCHGKKDHCDCCKGEGWTAKHVWESHGNNRKAKR
jgi:hypothetical protein